MVMAAGVQVNLEATTIAHDASVHTVYAATRGGDNQRPTDAAQLVKGGPFPPPLTLHLIAFREETERDVFVPHQLAGILMCPFRMLRNRSGFQVQENDKTKSTHCISRKKSDWNFVKRLGTQPVLY